MNDNYLWDRTGEPDPEIQKLEEVLGALRYKDDNYLWDRTGEADLEIQELEEVLGTLRYQPRPLEIPAHIRIARKQTFIPLAIAAAVAMFVVGAGLWFHFSRSQSSPPVQAKSDFRNEPSNVPPSPVASPNQTENSSASEKLTPRRQRQPKATQLAVNNRRGPRIPYRQPALTAQELAEKEQVLVALRLASAKLNLAQRKVQGLPQRNIFRNQNKIG